jgi:hypothetical protein
MVEVEGRPTTRKKSGERRQWKEKVETDVEWEHLKTLQRTSPSGASSSLRTIPNSPSSFLSRQAQTAPFGAEKCLGFLF